MVCVSVIPIYFSRKLYFCIKNIKNNSSEPRTVQADLSAESMYYTGVRANIVKKASGRFQVSPNASMVFFSIFTKYYNLSKEI